MKHSQSLPCFVEYGRKMVVPLRVVCKSKSNMFVGTDRLYWNMDRSVSFPWKDHWLCFQWVECDKPRRRPCCYFLKIRIYNCSCIIIYNNNSEMTVKTVYIHIILLPNILCLQHFSSNPLNQQQHIRSSMLTMRSHWQFRNCQGSHQTHWI